MKRQKKQYRPIAGQTRFEKFLDWITQEEFDDLMMKYHFALKGMPWHICHGIYRIKRQ